MDIKKLVRPNVKELKPYEPGKPIEEVQRELKLGDVVKMASNENPLGPSPFAVKAIKSGLDRLHFYPDGSGYYLRKKLSAFLNVGKDSIILGNGSDEIIQIIAETFLNEGEEVVIADPSFVIYQMAVRIMNGNCRLVKLKNYQYDMAAMAGAVGNKTKLIFIANPNNPTGTMVTEDEIESFLEKVPEEVIVIFDEAYFEYIERDDFPKTIDYIKDGKTVICLRTFSKIYGLAGLRIGYGIGCPEIITEMNRVRHPFNSNSIAQTAAAAALDDEEHVRKSREVNSAGRAFLYRELDRMGISYIPSEANFILIKVGDGSHVVEALLRKGIIVRGMDGYDMPDFIRLTIGFEKENRRFVEALDKIL